MKDDAVPDTPNGRIDPEKELLEALHNVTYSHSSKGSQMIICRL
jgi:hypothetical protein